LVYFRRDCWNSINTINIDKPKETPTLKQAHLQVAPANPHAKTWQRACLPKRTDRMTIQQKLKKNNKKS